FPNSYSVYLHDTSTPGLFAKKDRAFSHGCIRVSTPEHLALFLLRSDADGWTAERLRQILDSGKNTIVKLPEPIPVHLIYRTAWVEKDGSVEFRPDLYHRDDKMAAVMFKKSGDRGPLERENSAKKRR